MPTARPPAEATPLPPPVAPVPLAPPLPHGAGPTIEAIAELDEAIRDAWENFGDLAPDEANQVTRSLTVPYLSAPKLLRAVRAPLAAQGVLITSALRVAGSHFIVTTTLSHLSGGWRSSDWPILDMSQDRGVAVGAGWGLRQNLLQLLALSPSDVGEPAPPAVAEPPAPQAQVWRPPTAPPAGPTLPGEPPPWQPPAPVQPSPSDFI
jgi:hypothetical protein